MTGFYKIAEEVGTQENEFALRNLGNQINFNRIVNYGAGSIGVEKASRPTIPEDYDTCFIDTLFQINPIYKTDYFLDFHFDNYQADKKEFLAHVKYMILPLVKKEKHKEGYVQLIIDWIANKETKQKQTFEVVNYNITTGDINSPTQFQQGSTNSTQTQTLNYSKDELLTFFDLIKADFEKLSIEFREDLNSEIEYSIKQLDKEKNITAQLKNIGSLIKDIGINVFANLLASPIYEAIKPAIGL